MKSPYVAKFLSWCKSYEEEVKDMEEYIDAEPSDVKQLRKEYEILTGKQYRKKWGISKKYPSFNELEETKEEQYIRRERGY